MTSHVVRWGKTLIVCGRAECLLNHSTLHSTPAPLPLAEIWIVCSVWSKIRAATQLRSYRLVYDVTNVLSFTRPSSPLAVLCTRLYPTCAAFNTVLPLILWYMHAGVRIGIGRPLSHDVSKPMDSLTANPDQQADQIVL